MGDYITIDDIQEFTRTTYTADTTPNIDTINNYIDRYEAMINQRTGRAWGVETHTSEVYDSPDYEILLKYYPVLTISTVTDTDGEPLTEGIDNDYTIDGDFIVFNPNTIKPKRVYVTYTSGYDPVREDVVELAILLVTSKIKQSESASGNNTNKIKLGPISIEKSLGLQTVTNIDSDIKTLWRSIRRLVRNRRDY